MIKIPPAIQAKIGPFLKNRWVLWGSRYAAVLLVFLIVNWPLGSKLHEVSKTYQFQSDQIEAAKKGGFKLLDPREMMDLKLRADQFEKGFVDHAHVALVLGAISDQAIQNHFKVSKMNSDPMVPIQDAKLMRVPVNLQFEANFATIGDFLKALQSASPYSFVVESLSLQKSDPALEQVQCEMTLSFFSLG